MNVTFLASFRNKKNYKYIAIASIAVLVILGLVFHRQLKKLGHVLGLSTFTVQNLGTTATQAVLSYTAPDSNSCTVEVSESSSYTPLVHDVDPAIFAGSNVDTRPGNPGNGTYRVLVIGKRAAERGVDNSFYSRALQTNTVHYYRITCGTSSATGQFTTTNIPVGDTYLEQQPVDPAHPGNYAWPTISPTDHNQIIIDPQTGLQFRHMAMPTDVGFPFEGGALNVVNSSSWTNAASSAVTGQGGAFTSDNTGTLFMGQDPNGYNGQLATGYQGYGGSTAYNLWFQAHIRAKVSGSCGNVDDCKIVACLTIDGVQCYSGSAQYERQLTSSYTTEDFGTTGTALDLWQTPNSGAVLPNGPQERARTGTVTCNGSTNVVYTGGYIFGIWWAPGSHITINGTDYSIASVNNSRNITLTTSCPAATNVGYFAETFGVLLRKKTTSSNVVNVDSASVTATAATPQGWTVGGSDLCSDTTVVGANGDPGYNCILSGTNYWVDANTGESHVISGSNASLFPGACGDSSFESADPDTTFCISGSTIYEKTYVGDHLDYPKPNGVADVNDYSKIPNCTSSSAPVTRSNANNKPCIIVKNITQGLDILSLAHSFNPAFPNDRFLQLSTPGADSSDRILFLAARGNAQFNIGWEIVYDPKATSNANSDGSGCIGGGLPGCVIATKSSYASPNERWCPLKGGALVAPNWLETFHYFWGGPGDTTQGKGPYQVNVVNNGFFDNTSTISSCPSNPYPTEGNSCTTVQVDGQPYDASPCTAGASQCGGAVETGARGELLNAAVGDYVGLGDPVGVSQSEVMRILKIDPNNTWTLQRNIVQAGSDYTMTRNSGTNPTLYFGCNGAPTPGLDANQSGDASFWNYAADPFGTNTSGSTVLGDSYGYGDHSFFINGMSAVASSIDQRCLVAYTCYQTRVGTDIPTILTTPPAAIIERDFGFAGKSGYSGSEEIQSHPTSAGKLRNPKDSFLDGRPFKGAFISGSNAGNGSNPATLVGGQLWKFTSAQLPYVDRKFMPSRATSGGHMLKDISSATIGDVISTDTTDSYEYCYVNSAGECRTGSSIGDLYVNAPYVVFPYCYTGAQNEQMSDENDICFANNLQTYDSIMQASLLDTSNQGETTRALTHGLTRTRSTSVFWSPSAITNGKFMIVESAYGGDGNQGIVYLMAKLPPFPQYDNVARNTFMPVPVSITAPADTNVNNAIVEFGYAENGSPDNFYCTTRQETCVADGSSVNLTTPFKFTSENPIGMPCTSSCTIIVPALPQHVLYVRVKFRNSSNVVVSSTVMQAGTTEPPFTLSSAAVSTSAPSGPAISSISSGSISTTGATITWTTDTNSNSQVLYGINTFYSSSTTVNSTLTTNHSVTLTGLLPGTLYHYQVRSVDGNGTTLSSDQTFTTTAIVSNPVISSISANSITATGAVIHWQTDVSTNAIVLYGTTSGYGSSTTLNGTLSQTHDEVISSLAPATLYHYQVRSSDANGNATASSDHTFTTSSAMTPSPSISSVSSGNITTNSAVITWQTDLQADSIVLYGSTSSYGSSTALDSTLGLSHTVTVSGLAPATLYHYQVRSSDANGNASSSQDQTFTTASIPSSGGGGGGGTSSVTPTVSIINPSQTNSVGGTLFLTASVSSPYSIATVIFYVDNVIVGSAHTVAPYIQTYDTAQLRDGTHSLKVEARDVFGNVGATIQNFVVANINFSTGNPNSNVPVTSVHPEGCVINNLGTYYLVASNQLHGITNPGILFSHGYDLNAAVQASTGDLALPIGSNLTPADGSLVKSASDPTVYLISKSQRHAFVSSDVYKKLSYKFSAVVTVTQPELDSLPLGDIITTSSIEHPEGFNINQRGTIYWLDGGEKHPYPSLQIYNTWNVPNDFSTVVPANSKDQNIPGGDVVTPRSVCQ